MAITALLLLPLIPSSAAQVPKVECQIEFCYIHIFSKMNYDPLEIVVRPGANITWIIHVVEPFTVTSGNGSSDPNSGKLFDSGVIRLPFNSTFSVKLKERGDFSFYSRFYPELLGKITVRGDAFVVKEPAKIETPKPQDQIRNILTQNKSMQILPEKTSPYIVEYALPDSKSGPVAIAADDKGNIWFVEWNASKLAVLFPNNNTLKEFRIPGSNASLQVWSILIEKGQIWFGESESNSVWRFSASNETFQQYIVPTQYSGIVQLVIDKSGNIWLTELYENKIARLVTKELSAGTSKGIIEYTLPTSNSGPAGLAIDKSGNIWITETFAKKLARLDPETLTFNTFEFPATVYSPLGIGVDQSGIWVASHGSNKIVKFDPLSKSMKEYSTSQATGSPISLPYWILIDKQSNIWFNEHAGGKIAKFSPESETLVEYVVPNGLNSILHMALDDSGNAWFAQSVTGKIGKIDTSTKPWFEVSLSSKILQSNGGNVSLGITVFSENPQKKELTLGLMNGQSITGKLGNITSSFKASKISKQGAISESLLVLSPSKSAQEGNYSFTVSVADDSIVSSAVFVLNLDSIPKEPLSKAPVAQPQNNPPSREPGKEPPNLSEVQSPHDNGQPVSLTTTLLIITPAIILCGVALYILQRRGKRS